MSKAPAAPASNGTSSTITNSPPPAQIAQEDPVAAAASSYGGKSRPAVGAPAGISSRTTGPTRYLQPACGHQWIVLMDPEIRRLQGRGGQH